MNAPQNPRYPVFASLLDRDLLEEAKIIYDGLNEHRKLDALASAIPAQALYFQEWIRRGAPSTKAPQACEDILKVSTEGQYDVVLSKGPEGLFTVTYGNEVQSLMGYSVAARTFGDCVFHALSCAGKLEA